MTLSVTDAKSLQEQADDGVLDIKPTLSWEYWDGQYWRVLEGLADHDTNKLQVEGTIGSLLDLLIS